MDFENSPPDQDEFDGPDEPNAAGGTKPRLEVHPSLLDKSIMSKFWAGSSPSRVNIPLQTANDQLLVPYNSPEISPPTEAEAFQQTMEAMSQTLRNVQIHRKRGPTVRFTLPVAFPEDNAALPPSMRAPRRQFSLPVSEDASRPASQLSFYPDDDRPNHFFDPRGNKLKCTYYSHQVPESSRVSVRSNPIYRGHFGRRPGLNRNELEQITLSLQNATIQSNDSVEMSPEAVAMLQRNPNLKCRTRPPEEVMKFAKPEFPIPLPWQSPIPGNSTAPPNLDDL